MCNPIVKLGIPCVRGYALVNKNAAEYRAYIGVPRWVKNSIKSFCDKRARTTHRAPIRRDTIIFEYQIPPYDEI